MIAAFRTREAAMMVGPEAARQLEPLRPEEMVCGRCGNSMRPGQIAWLRGMRFHASCARAAAPSLFNYLGSKT
jgi:hypothetical protein